MHTQNYNVAKVFIEEGIQQQSIYGTDQQEKR